MCSDADTLELRATEGVVFLSEQVAAQYYTALQLDDQGREAMAQLLRKELSRFVSQLDN